MLTVAEALASILRQVKPLGAVQTPLLDARGMVLAEDISADIDNPPFDNSAVDGFGVRAVDVKSASYGSPVELRCVGEVPAGTFPRKAIGPGECMRVMTGAPIPAGADAMVMVEDARAEGSSVLVLEAAKPGNHVRPQGGDITAGQVVLKQGVIIEAPEIALLAAMGKAKVKTIRKPSIAVISTGDEVVDISKKPGPGQIRNSNQYAVAALVAEAGAKLHSAIHIKDDLDETREALKRCAGLTGTPAADLIVTSGGVSVGDRDFVKPVLEELGSLDLWRVKMKPGKPLAFGKVGKSLFFGLPGNPVSTMVTFELFVRPTIWRFAGRSSLERPRVRARLLDAVPHHPGREEYVRAQVSVQAGEFVAMPTGAQGSGILTSMLGANALLVVPEDSPGFASGEQAAAILTGPPLSTGAAAS